MTPPTNTLDCIGSYKLNSVLGRGGMGVVFLVEHRDTGQTVALKTLSEVESHLMRRLRAEVAVMRSRNRANALIGDLRISDCVRQA